MRESWNKILQRHTMNFERSNGPSVYSGHLEPFLHLYGHLNNCEWCATIEVYRWCEAIHALS